MDLGSPSASNNETTQAAASYVTQVRVALFLVLIGFILHAWMALHACLMLNAQLFSFWNALTSTMAMVRGTVDFQGKLVSSPWAYEQPQIMPCFENQLIITKLKNRNSCLELIGLSPEFSRGHDGFNSPQSITNQKIKI